MYDAGEPPPKYIQNRQLYRPLDRPSYSHRSRGDIEILEEYEDETSCATFAKYSIFAFNIIFLLVGTGTLALGVWLRIDSRFRDFLSERYRQAVDEAFWQAPTLYTFSYILIVLGAFMIVVAVVGCCGAISGSRLFLGFYGFAVFCLLISTVSSIIYVLYKKDGIDVELSDALNYMVQHYYQGAGIVQESLDRLQQAFRCCGNAGCSDFRAFRQDPPRTCDIRCDGCHYRIWLALRIGFSVAIVVFLIVILAQLVAVGVSVVMVVNDPKKKQYKYWARSSQPYQSTRYYNPYKSYRRENQNRPFTITQQQQRRQFNS
ncbi:Tetraspanin family protein [Aphelenchoides bicaudatus]|nr:Tetraspanin family protein [Aphelenchoides bicaudatus]